VPWRFSLQNLAECECALAIAKRRGVRQSSGAFRRTDTSDHDWMLAAGLGDADATPSRKRRRTAALQNLAECECALANRGASWSAPVPWRFSDRDTSDHDWMLAGGLRRCGRHTFRKRWSTTALQNLAECESGLVSRGASWSAPVPWRFSDRDTSDHDWMLAGGLRRCDATPSRKRRRTAALQNLAECERALVSRGASWSAPVPWRFSDL